MPEIDFTVVQVCDPNRAVYCQTEEKIRVAFFGIWFRVLPKAT